MALTVTHAKNVAIADDPKAAAAGEVLPSDWNANHTVAGTIDASVGGRKLLATDTSYYVSATGSDSNGGTNSTTDAWATIQHAMDFISSSVDIGGITITVNIGAGSFVGFGLKPTVGGGILQFIGAGSASTTINNGPNDGVFNQGECISALIIGAATTISINKVTLNATTVFGAIGILTGQWLFYLGSAIPVNPPLADLAFTGSGGGINTFGQSFIQTSAGAISFAGTGNTNGCIWYVQQGTQVYDDATWTITGTLDVSGLGLIVLGDTGTGSYFYMNLSSYTGTVTGPPYKINGGSILAFPAVRAPPGSSNPLVDGSSFVFDWTGNAGIINRFTVAGLPQAVYPNARALVTNSNSSLSAGLGNVVVASTSTSTSSIVPVWSDGTNWRIG